MTNNSRGTHKMWGSNHGHDCYFTVLDETHVMDMLGISSGAMGPSGKETWLTPKL